MVGPFKDLALASLNPIFSLIFLLSVQLWSPTQSHYWGSTSCGAHRFNPESSKHMFDAVMSRQRTFLMGSCYAEDMLRWCFSNAFRLLFDHFLSFFPSSRSHNLLLPLLLPSTCYLIVSCPFFPPHVLSTFSYRSTYNEKISRIQRKEPQRAGAAFKTTEASGP